MDIVDELNKLLYSSRENAYRCPPKAILMTEKSAEDLKNAYAEKAYTLVEARPGPSHNYISYMSLPIYRTNDLPPNTNCLVI